MSTRGSTRAIVSLAVAAALLAAGGAYWLHHQKQAAEREHAEEAAFDQTAGASMVGAGLSGLPSDSIVLGSIANLTAWGEGFRSTGMGQLLTDPDLREKARAAVAVQAGPEQIREFEAFLATIGEIGGLGLRSLAFSLHPLPGGGGENTGFVAIFACDDPEKVAAWLAGKTAAAAPGGPSATSGPGGARPTPPAAAGATSGAIQGIRYTCNEGVCWAVRSNTLLVARPAAALERFLGAPPAREGESEARLQQAIEQTGATPEGAFVFVDLKRAVAAARAAPGQPDQNKVLDLAGLDLAGLDALDSLAFSQRVESALLHDRAVLRYDPAHAGVIARLLAPPEGDLTLDKTFPGSLTSASFGRLPDLALAYDRLMDALHQPGVASPEEAAKLDQGLAMAKGFLGIDVRNDVLAAIGGELGFASLSAPAPAPGKAGAVEEWLRNPRFLLALEVRDQAKVDALLTRLEAFAKLRGMTLKSEPLGEGKLYPLPVPIAGATPVLAVAKTRIWAGLLADDVKSAIEGAGPTLAADPVFAELRARFAPDARWVAFNRAPGATLEQAYASYVEGYRQVKQTALDKTAGSLAEMARAVEAYRADNEGFVPRGRNLAELRAALAPVYRRNLPRTDAWGGTLGYAGNAEGWVVWSLGEDARAERDWSACTAACTLPEAAGGGEDLVVASGRALRGLRTGDNQRPAAPVFTPPQELQDLGAALSRHFSAWPASLAVTRGTPGVVEYESRAPVAMGALPGIVGSSALQGLIRSGAAAGGAAGGAGAGKAPAGASRGN